MYDNICFISPLARKIRKSLEQKPTELTKPLTSTVCYVQSSRLVHATLTGRSPKLTKLCAAEHFTLVYVDGMH